VRRPRRQPRLSRQEGHREGQHRQQERRELRLRPQKFVLQVFVRITFAVFVHITFFKLPIFCCVKRFFVKSPTNRM
jgi:hypothetical protein